MSRLLQAWGEERSPLCQPALRPLARHTSPRCPLLSSMALGRAGVPPAADTRSSKTPEFSWGVAWLVGTVHGAVTSADRAGGDGPGPWAFPSILALQGQQVFTACTYSAPALWETRGEPVCPPSGASLIGPGPFPSHV